MQGGDISTGGTGEAWNESCLTLQICSFCSLRVLRLDNVRMRSVPSVGWAQQKRGRARGLDGLKIKEACSRVAACGRRRSMYGGASDVW